MIAAPSDSMYFASPRKRRMGNIAITLLDISPKRREWSKIIYHAFLSCQVARERAMGNLSSSSLMSSL
jgi:hypothetical protein